MNAYKKIISLILVVMLATAMLSSCSLWNKITGKEDTSDDGAGSGNTETPDDSNNGQTGDNTTPTTPAPTSVVYTVTVKNAAGEAVEAKVMLVGEAYHIPAKTTNANGVVTFDVAPSSYWAAQLYEVPAGYTADLSVKYTFNDAYQAVIVLEAAATE